MTTTRVKHYVLSLANCQRRRPCPHMSSKRILLHCRNHNPHVGNHYLLAFMMASASAISSLLGRLTTII
jgi:hypothetical protein